MPYLVKFTFGGEYWAEALPMARAKKANNGARNFILLRVKIKLGDLGSGRETWKCLYMGLRSKKRKKKEKKKKRKVIDVPKAGRAVPSVAEAVTSCIWFYTVSGQYGQFYTKAV